MALFLAFLVGSLAGLRTFTPPAVVAWAAHLGWLKLEGMVAVMGATAAVVILTLLAAAELVVDKLPRTPNRTSLRGLIARVIAGKVSGMCLAVAGGESLWLGAGCGIVGAVIGCFGGYYARTKTVKALQLPDWPIALLEDLVAIAGCLWIVTAWR